MGLQMQEDVFRGLRGWRQAALPNDMEKQRDLNLHEWGCNTAAPAALHKEKTLHQRENLPQWHTNINYKNIAAYSTSIQGHS